MNELVFFVQLGLAMGTTPSVDLHGGDPLGVLRLGVEYNQWSIEYEHQSSVPDGPPVNGNKDQRWQERIGIFYRFEWRTR